MLIDDLVNPRCARCGVRYFEHRLDYSTEPVLELAPHGQWSLLVHYHAVFCADGVQVAGPPLKARHG
jgi:hypothetical protein